VVRSLKGQYIEQRQAYAALLKRYGDKWPAVRQLKTRMEMARADLEREIRNVLSGITLEHKRVAENEAKIAAALQAAKDEGLELNKKEVSYRRLKRTQENTAKLHSLVLGRLKESDLSAQLRVSNIRLLDEAVVPAKPVRPNVQVNLLLGALLGLLLGIGLAVLVDTFDNSIKSQEEIEQLGPVTVLGMVPRIPGTVPARRGERRPEPKPDLDLIVHRSPKSMIAESCRNIRTNILFASPDRPLKTIVVTSAGPREGKTTAAVSLAITMAQAGNRVLVVDTDMRRPRLHRVFGVPGAEGLTSVLLGDGQLDELTKATEIPGLSVLPCGPSPPNPAELCQSERFRALLEELERRYDRIVLDSPPVMLVTDGAVLSTQVDGTLLVARAGQTSRVALRDTIRQLDDVGCHLLGCVLNDVDLEKRGYGYYRYRRYGYYRYGYAYGHGYYNAPDGEDAPS
jgi:capsular exopolysaccharide synthesis family protein